MIASCAPFPKPGRSGLAQNLGAVASRMSSSLETCPQSTGGKRRKGPTQRWKRGSPAWHDSAWPLGDALGEDARQTRSNATSSSGRLLSGVTSSALH